MAARPTHPGVDPDEGLDVLVAAAGALGSAATRSEALYVVAEAAARAARADVVVARVADLESKRLGVSTVATGSAAVAAEVEGSWLPLSELPAAEETDRGRLPRAILRVAERVRAAAVLVVPVLVDGSPVGSLELMRSGLPFTEPERRLARLSAVQAALVIRAFVKGPESGNGGAAAAALDVAGDALAAAADEAQTAEHLTRLAAEAAGAACGLLWDYEPDRGSKLAASYCLGELDASFLTASDAAERALRRRNAVTVERVSGLPGGAEVSATLQLGQPPFGALQLLFDRAHAPTDDDLSVFATFGVRAAHTLRVRARSRTNALELERTRALLAVVGQAISELSLAHTLETTVERVAELLDADRLAVYLREDRRLTAAAGTGLAGPHVQVAERLLALALGPYRSRGVLVVPDVRSDARMSSVGDAAAEAGVEAAVAVPLLVRDEVIGLLAVFPTDRRLPNENETELLAALAAQLAVAVQNAQLHEQAKLLGAERERALEAERAASRQVGALYEISRSFAQSLSLSATLDALAATIVDVLDVDAALIGMPDERRDWLVPRAIHIAEPRVGEPLRSILHTEQPFGAQPIQKLFRIGEPLLLTSRAVRRMGGNAVRLLPFLERGWTAAAVPIATPAEVLAALTIVSMRPGAPVTPETIEQATRIAGQAALAIDNARLYQQQKEFSDTMQRSLLPRSVPQLQGLELGDAYESSARVEVGGDVYDYMELPDGRLAVALGDVTGHGIGAAADMAMAKFVFRSLAREHPEPGDFLQAANDVVVDEIAPGKFITMIYLVIDGRSGAISAAGAGHPPPRLLAPDGTVTSIDVRGLVLGIEPGQQYEKLRASLETGAAVVLYTDGVVEARWEGELYGVERLDRVLSEQRELEPAALARAALDDCRAFARGELADDCAIVVVRRSG